MLGRTGRALRLSRPRLQLLRCSAVVSVPACTSPFHSFAPCSFMSSPRAASQHLTTPTSPLPVLDTWRIQEQLYVNETWSNERGMFLGIASLLTVGLLYALHDRIQHPSEYPSLLQEARQLADSDETLVAALSSQHQEAKPEDIVPPAHIDEEAAFLQAETEKWLRAREKKRERVKHVIPHTSTSVFDEPSASSSAADESSSVDVSKVLPSAPSVGGLTQWLRKINDERGVKRPRELGIVERLSATLFEVDQQGSRSEVWAELPDTSLGPGQIHVVGNRRHSIVQRIVDLPEQRGSAAAATPASHASADETQTNIDVSESKWNVQQVELIFPQALPLPRCYALDSHSGRFILREGLQCPPLRLVGMGRLVTREPGVGSWMREHSAASVLGCSVALGLLGFASLRRWQSPRQSWWSRQLILELRDHPTLRAALKLRDTDALGSYYSLIWAPLKVGPQIQVTQFFSAFHPTPVSFAEKIGGSPCLRQVFSLRSLRAEGFLRVQSERSPWPIKIAGAPLYWFRQWGMTRCVLTVGEHTFEIKADAASASSAPPTNGKQMR